MHKRDDLHRRIRAEFREMPGMRLTVPQAARLWQMEADRCRRLLDELAVLGVLCRLPDESYALASEAMSA